MWLHIPSSVYSAEQECSTLPCDAQFQALALSVSWRGKLQRPQSWRRVWQTAACAKLLSGPTLEPSTAARLMAEWTASLAVSHAPISAWQDAKPGSTETPADSFLSTSESFAKFSPDGSLLRTSRQFSLFQQDEPYLANLPRSGSMRNGELYERPMLAPRIDGTGLSSSHIEAAWPTPAANDDNKSPEAYRHMREHKLGRTGKAAETISSLQVKVQTWPTPDCNTSSYSNGKFGENLREASMNWPAPRTEDSESCGNHPGAVASLTGATRQWATPNARDVLNPGSPDGQRSQRKLEQGWTIDLNDQAAWWTTPQAHDAAGGNPERVGRFGTKHGGANLADDVTLWKTPDVPNGGRTMSAADVAANGATDKGKRQVGLENQVRYTAWPTPGTGTPNSLRGSAQHPDIRRANGHQVNLQNVACHSFPQAQPTPKPGSESLPSGPTSRRRLNPAFVDWLMGLPPGWTDYAPVETALWFSRVRMRLACLLNERG